MTFPKIALITGPSALFLCSSDRSVTVLLVEAALVSFNSRPLIRGGLETKRPLITPYIAALLFEVVTLMSALIPFMIVQKSSNTFLP